MTHPGKFRSLLATARIANVPSVISNVWAGTALTVYLSSGNPDEVWLDAALLALAGVLLYLCGNFFNDWKDRDWDAANRPERALPRGLFSSRLYLWCGLGFAMVGSALAFYVSVWSGLIALGILSSIGTYTHWHKEAAWAVIPMGLCRALLPLMGIFAGTDPDGDDLTVSLALILIHAVALFFYICGLSISARGEARATPSSKPPLTGRLMLGFAGICAATYWLSDYPQGAWIAAAPFVIWTTLALTLFRRPISAHVSSLLAGIPLLDAIPLLSVAALVSLAQGGGLFASTFATACVLVPFISFALGRRLQRVASAT
jgi:heme O synthase-like polyprenyltransferase